MYINTNMNINVNIKISMVPLNKKKLLLWFKYILECHFVVWIFLGQGGDDGGGFVFEGRGGILFPILFSL